MKPKRYEIIRRTGSAWKLLENDAGSWCKSEDVAKLEAEIERLNKLLTKDLIYWEVGREEDYLSEEPWEIADRVADEHLGPGEEKIVEVQVAARLPDRKMRVWLDANGDMKWEWVE
ncbi:MAG: hypothetical protein K0041_05215 [Acidithiobacillus sp.]|nr:hypothetical protein [Acidithiobacillus sp.]